MARGMAAHKLVDSKLSLFGKAKGVTRIEARSGGARGSASSLEGAGDGGALQVNPEEGSTLEPFDACRERAFGGMATCMATGGLNTKPPILSQVLGDGVVVARRQEVIDYLAWDLSTSKHPRPA